RIHLTLHKLPQVLDGSLDELVEALEMAHQEELLQATNA
ncbi:MAG: peptide chain release factor 1, partial [Gemmatimonadetes bacterium]|nr:peptide chain release factor 1 [Gemmatimonadota bacterium]